LSQTSIENLMLIFAFSALMKTQMLEQEENQYDGNCVHPRLPRNRQRGDKEDAS
jgi:hypothetical protein